MDDKVPSASGNGPIFIKPSTWEKLRKLVESLKILPDPRHFITSRKNGKTFFSLKDPAAQDPRAGGSHPIPFFTTLIPDGAAWKITMEDGKVVNRILKAGDSVILIDVTGIPTKESPLTVAAGDKVWVKVTEDESGSAIEAEIGTGSSWPESLAPVLLGGDNTSGTQGERYYRIAQFTADGDNLLREQILTGHIDHFQPTLVENLIASASTGQARLMKQWNETEGRWELRYLQAGDGVIISEDGDFITFSGSHPWKATASGGNINIAAGKLFYPSPKGSDPADVTPIIYDYVAFAGGSVTPSGAGWVYAKAEVAGAVTVGGQDGLNIQTTGSDLISVLLEVRTLASLAVVFSEYDPSTYDPEDGNIYFPIAQVSSTDGVASVIDQILTHNPHDSLHKITFS